MTLGISQGRPALRPWPEHNGTSGPDGTSGPESQKTALLANQGLMRAKKRACELQNKLHTIDKILNLGVVRYMDDG